MLGRSGHAAGERQAEVGKEKVQLLQDVAVLNINIQYNMLGCVRGTEM